MREPLPPKAVFSPWQNARLFALLNMALADGYVAMSATKNHYSYWRPVTAIRAGETDGNPDTAGDPAWTPLRPTPPNQDYASGHSIEGGVGAEVLKEVFGTDGVSFQDCGVKLPSEAPAAIRHPCSAPIAASPKRLRRMRFRASSLDSISANRSKKERNTVEKLASAPPLATSSLCAKVGLAICVSSASPEIRRYSRLPRRSLFLPFYAEIVHG